MSKKERSEFQQKGSVGFYTYFLYFTTGGTWFGIVSALTVLFLFVAAQALMIVTDFWLSTWWGLLHKCVNELYQFE